MVHTQHSVKTITRSDSLANNENAIEYWHSKLLEMNRIDLRIKSIIFDFFIFKKRNLLDKLFFRHPIEKRQFSTTGKTSLRLIKKRIAFEGWSQPSYAHIGVTKEDEVVFLRNNPVDRDRNPVCGYFIYPENGRGYNGLVISPIDIVAITFE